MTRLRTCAQCGLDGAPKATFCRRCGARFEGVPLDAPEAAAPASAFDERRLLRELAWLCALPVILSLAYGVEQHIAGLSAFVELAMDALLGAVALAGAMLNWSLVRDALRWPTLRDIGATLMVAVLVGPAITLVFALLQALGFQLYDGYFDAFAHDAWPAWTAYLSLAVLTPISEELLFRGLIQPKLGQLLAPTEAVIVQAALFSAAHLSVVILLTHFMMGLAFGWLRRFTGSLLPSLLLHGAWNAWVLWTASH